MRQPRRRRLHSSSSSSSSSTATISANDFLTLLVTEMQNQDPTADTDPNEYINQLVNVNSLEQLISINQTLTTDLQQPRPRPAPRRRNGSLDRRRRQAPGQRSSGARRDRRRRPRIPSAIGAATAKLAPGNLSVPAGNPAAQRVAQSLSGRSSAQ